MADLNVLMNELIQARRAYTLGQTAPTPNWTLRLFTAPGAIDCTLGFGDFTEPTLAGYAPITLSPPTWTGSLAACVDTWSYPAQTFSFTAGGQTIRGHFVYDADNGVLGWADLWDTPFVVPAGGGEVQVSLQWMEKQC